VRGRRDEEGKVYGRENAMRKQCDRKGKATRGRTMRQKTLPEREKTLPERGNDTEEKVT
jgi:hypothetical protein